MGALGTARSAYVALCVGLAVVAVFATAMNGAAGSALYLVGAAYGTLLSIVGASRMPVARRRIWWAFAAGEVMFLVGDSLWTLFEDVLHIEPFPSVADVAYLAQYPALALGMLWLVRGRRRGRDRAAFLDAAILTTGFTVVGTVFFIVPAAETGGSTLLSQVVAAAYPAGDLLVLALVVRMFTAEFARNEALWAVFGAIAIMLVADLGYVVAVVHGLPYPGWIDIGYLLTYLLLGFAVLHPSAGALSEPAPERSDRLSGARMLLLGAALLLAPLTGQVAHLTGVEHAEWMAFFGGCVAAVLVVLRLSNLVQDLQRTAVQLAALARRDGLTGVPNRRTWDHELSRSCAIARDEGTPLTVAVLDMDNFKLFNDTSGHLKGDLVLKETATAWASLLEGRGFLARFGGEEFTALIPSVTADEAVAVLDQMRRSVTHDQTCSIGAAMWDGAESPAALLARADRALYHAKHSGRDQLAIDDGQAAKVATRTAAESPLLASLRSVYQPIVDLRTGDVIGREALSRFEGYDPRDVFDRAHRDGASGALEAAAIRKAVAGWDGDGLLALNASLTALETGHVQLALPENLSGIVVEITEADLVGYTVDVMLAIEGLRARGALIAIDDVGVGFSNVHRIVTLRPDILKVDMSLIRGIDADPARQAAVAAALLFAERTSSQVIAEGIETPEERDCLVGLGVPFGQGYLLGVPMPLPTRSFSGR
jgi:diguanylate cyclase (GGDEF)-like protein